MSACGSRMLNPLYPSTFAQAAWIQRATGGLSTVTYPAGSNDPKKKFDAF